MTEWKEETINDVCIKVTDGSHSSPKAVEKGYYMASVKDFRKYDFDFSECKQISEEDYFSLVKSGCVPEKEDILIGKDGARYFEDIIVYEQDEKPALLSSIAILRCDKEKIDPYFLYYMLQVPSVRKDVKDNYGSGSAIPRIILKDFKRMPIRYPSLEIQKSLITILKNIDSKIKLNEKINRNLSEQLDALYDNWFGKYKPYNMGIGGDPNYELEDGWHIEDIYSIADIIYGAPFASKLFNTEGEGRPIVRIRDLKNQELCTFTPEEHPKGYLLQPGDIVVGMDGEFKPYIWGNEEAWLNQRVCVFNNKRANGKAYVYCTIKPLLYSVEATEVATTVIHIGKKDYDEFRVVLPPEGVLAEFEAISKPMFDQIVEGQLENRRLIALRDSLLPRLMSGELDVSDLNI